MASQISGALAERGTCATTWLSWIARNMSMDWQNSAIGRLRQWAAAHSSHFTHPCPWDTFLTNANGCGRHGRALGRDMMLV